MGLVLSIAVRGAIVEAITAVIDAGSGPGAIEVRTGSQPYNPDEAGTGTLLVTFALPEPAFEAPIDGTAALGTVEDAVAVATGSAGWFRILDGSGAPVIDGTVGSDLSFNTSDIVSGDPVAIEAGQVTMPYGY